MREPLGNSTLRAWFHRAFAALGGTRLADAVPKPAEPDARAGYSLHPSTGETVFDDRPLRFRNLTLAEADLPALEDEPDSVPGFKIRISKLRSGRQQAETLVDHRYEGRGYQIPGLKKERELSTFIAYDEGQLVGTVAVRLDSRRGLAADELYAEEIDALRARGYRICEFTRLAINRTSASKPVLAGLFHTAYLYAAVIRGTTHAVIEVNPRHVVFYRRLLRFEVLGAERLNQRVKAPAVLLWVPFATIAEGLARHAGSREETPAERSLFRFGFPADEEAGVLRRLRELVADR